MMIKDWKREILTIPNLLSLFRLILIPVYVRIYLNASEAIHYCMAGIILTLSCLTDLIDGKIARKFNMVSTVGKILDPLADKATQFTLLLCLANRYDVLRKIVALFVLKESFQLMAGLFALLKGKMLKRALYSGKLCTSALFLTLILLVLFPELNKQAVAIMAAIDTGFMLVAFGDYIWTYCKHSPMIQRITSDGT